MNIFGVKLLTWEVHLSSSNLKHRRRQDLMGTGPENRKQFVDAQP